MIRLALAVALTVSGTGVAADSSANALIVQSVQAWEAAHRSDGKLCKLVSLELAKSTVDELMQKHARSDLAVEVALGRAGLPFSLEDLRIALFAAQDAVEQDSKISRTADLVTRSIRSSGHILENVPVDLEGAVDQYLLAHQANLAMQAAIQSLSSERENESCEAVHLLSARSSSLADTAVTLANFCNGRDPKQCLLFNAEHLAANIDEPPWAVDAFIEIARLHAASGNSDSSRRALTSALDISRGAGKENLGHAYTKTAIANAEFGELDEALAIVSLFSSPTARASVLKRVILASTAAGNEGNFEDAFIELEIAASALEPTQNKWELLYDLGLALRAAGQDAESSRIFGAAALSATTIKEPLERFMNSAELATKLAKDGLFEEAEKIALEREAPLSDLLLMRIALAQIEARVFESAERVAISIQDSEKKAIVLSALASKRAILLAASGQRVEAEHLLAEAERYAAEISLSEKWRDDRMKAEARIAEAYAELGDKRKALRILKWVERKDPEGAMPRLEFSFSDLVAVYAREGLLVEAERISSEVRDHGERLFALMAVATAYAEAGQFAEAKRIADDIDNLSFRSFTFSNLAMSAASVGNFADAERFILGISADRQYHVNDAVLALATAYAEAGQFAEAKRIADDIGNPQAKLNALLALIAQL